MTGAWSLPARPARHPVLLGGMALVVAAAIFGAGVFGTLKSGGFQDPNSESSHAQQVLDQQFSGAATDIVILLRSDTLNATDPAFASAAARWERMERMVGSAGRWDDRRGTECDPIQGQALFVRQGH